MYNAPRGQKTASGRGTEFFDVFDEELGGGRPPPLPEVAGSQARVLRRTVEQIIESFVPVQMIDVPVPQSSMGGVLDQILQCTAEMVPEEVILVIEVPKISSLLCPPPRRVIPFGAVGGAVGGSADAALVCRNGSRLEGLFEARTSTYYRRPGGSWRGWCSWRSSRFSCWTEFISAFGADRRNSCSSGLWWRWCSWRSSRFSPRTGLNSGLWSRSLTFQLAEVFQILSLAWVLLPHRVVYGTMQMRMLQGFFALFPGRKKCEVGLALGVGTAPRVEPIHAASL